MADRGVVDRVAAAGGAALAAATRAVDVVRPAAKPLHPAGDLLAGTVVRRGAEGQPRTGVPWLDEPGEDDVLVRLSRAVGLPPALPDIHGLAVRVPVRDASGRERAGDLLLASTGTGPLTRFLLAPGRRLGSRSLTTLLPYRSPTGPLLLRAQPDRDARESSELGTTGSATGELAFRLSWARPGGAWIGFGTLTVPGGPAADPVVSFDPVLHVLPGLTHYGWVRRLREPSYATARSRRPEDDLA